MRSASKSQNMNRSAPVVDESFVNLETLNHKADVFEDATGFFPSVGTYAPVESDKGKESA